ncbi:MAG: hypothetical protein PHH91_14580 [Desulfuromonadaceae bacterium]|nr:hypothetical protein [Desulfuromonadaceae bacterium]
MLDISKVETGGTRVWVPILEGFRAQFTHIAQDEYDALRKSCQVLEEKDGKLEGPVDETAFRHKLAMRVTTAWEGIGDGDAPYPCTPDNIKYISDKVTEYRLALFSKPLSLTLMLAAEREEQKKS